MAGAWQFRFCMTDQIQAGFGQRVRKARLYAGYTQREVAKAMGCTPRTIWGWEQPDSSTRAIRAPSPKLLREFASVTRCDVVWLYEGVKPHGADDHPHYRRDDQDDAER